MDQRLIHYHEHIFANSNNFHLCYKPSFAESTPGLKQEGDVCGSCFNPENNFFCGKCDSGLACVKDPKTDVLPDLPSRCRRENV